MRPSNLQSRLIDTYGTLCDENGLNRLPFAEAKRLSIDTLRHLIAWQTHVKKHKDNEFPPPFEGTPPGGWAAFAKRGAPAEVPATKKTQSGGGESDAARQLRFLQRGTSRPFRQAQAIKRIAREE